MVVRWVAELWAWVVVEWVWEAVWVVEWAAVWTTIKVALALASHNNLIKCKTISRSNSNMPKISFRQCNNNPEASAVSVAAAPNKIWEEVAVVA